MQYLGIKVRTLELLALRKQGTLGLNRLNFRCALGTILTQTTSEEMLGVHPTQQNIATLLATEALLLILGAWKYTRSGQPAQRSTS